MQVQLPPMQRMIRKVDELFLSQLIINMEKHPNGAYEPLFLLVKDLKSKVDFNSNEISRGVDDEALWLASQHNTTGSFRHEITFQDEASILKICSYRRPIFM